jgi:hypothetical protein
MRAARVRPHDGPHPDKEIVAVKLLPILALAVLFVGTTHAAANNGQPTTESVRQLLDALGSKGMLSTVQGQLDTMMKKSVEQALSGKTVTPAQQLILDDMRAKVIALVTAQLNWESIEPIFIDIYQKNFTQKEVDGMLTFYRSDVGKAVVAKLPQAMLASMETMQSKMMTIAPQIQELQRNMIRKLQASEVLQDPSNPAPQKSN